jgi:hypothetical protein
MKKTNTVLKLSIASMTALVLGGTSMASAQSADALIDKLVDKGILTVKEANELREEADKNFNQAYSVKSGMPDWVNSLKLNGDVRVRYENFTSDDRFVSGGSTNQFVSRNRYRYRLRFGATATFFDNLEAGFRLTSSEPGRGDAVFGGDPISGNSTFQNNASKKFLYIDQVYGKWSALNGPDLTASLTLGKMENPFVFSDMVFDGDMTPEGAAIQSGYRLSDKQSLKLNLGGFLLDEIGTSSSDPYLLGAQVRWDAAWSKKLSTSAGIAGLMIDNSEMLINSAVPDMNTGNTRNGPTGILAYNFNPVVVDASATYTLEKVPFYRGAFPIKVGGEYMNNPAAPHGADNYAWNAGIVFGKSGKKGTWDLSYTYKWLGANAWYEELVDSDFGGLYFMAPPGGGSGYQSGTNIRGHIIRLAYSPADALTLSAKWFGTELIQPYPTAEQTSMNRFQVDASLKF